MRRPDQSRQVFVAICSRDRPKMLRRCLAGLARVPVPDGWIVNALIVDNSSDSFAHEYKAIAEEFGTFAYYAREVRAGLSFARNKALDVAKEMNRNWLIFMDDDEWPDDNWLFAYDKALSKFRYGLVFSGPVRMLDPAGERVKTPFTHREHLLKLGSPMREAFTNNVMLYVPMLEETGSRFREEFNFSGGEDSEFFRRLQVNGYTLRWVPDAIVYEEVISERITLRYLFDRVLRNAINALRIDRELEPKYRPMKSAWRGIRRTIEGAVFFLAGLVLWLPFRNLGERAISRGTQRTAAGIGLIAGLMGYVVEPYRTTDGS